MDHLNPVTRLRRQKTGEDRYGNDLFEEVPTELPPALFAPKDEIPVAEPGRAPVVTVPTLYWRRQWPDVLASDRLTVRGVTYDVQTDPADWRGQFTGGLVVKLRDTREGVV